jgi:flagellar motor switch protein FliM
MRFAQPPPMEHIVPAHSTAATRPQKYDLMSAQDILGQDDIDALLRQAQGGPAEAEAEPEIVLGADGKPFDYDFGHSARIVRGRMPTLEMINERFARLLRTTLYNLLRRTASVSVGSVEFLKFSDYVNRLMLPTSLNLVQFHPLRGTGLFVLDPKLVFSLVDILFGGKGRHVKIEGREFTALETRLIHTLLGSAFDNLREAWSHVVELKLQLVGSEVNPHFANIVSPTEIIIVSTFQIDFDDQGGELHIAAPYSMFEPLREILESGMQSDRVEHDDRWTQALRLELQDAEVELSAHLGEVSLKLGEVLKLAPGDILDCDFNGSVTLYAEDVPMFRGTYGRSGGQHALKVTEHIGRARRSILNALSAEARGT